MLQTCCLRNNIMRRSLLLLPLRPLLSRSPLARKLPKIRLKPPWTRLLPTRKPTWKPLAPNWMKLAPNWKPVLKTWLPTPTQLLPKSKLKSKAKPKLKHRPTNRASASERFTVSKQERAVPRGAALFPCNHIFLTGPYGPRTRELYSPPYSALAHARSSLAARPKPRYSASVIVEMRPSRKRRASSFCARLPFSTAIEGLWPVT